MNFRHRFRNYLFMGILWIAIASFLFSSFMLAVDRKVDVSIFNYALAQVATGTIVNNVDMTGTAFVPDRITETCGIGDRVEIVFHARDGTYTVRGPGGWSPVTMFIVQGFSETVEGTVDESMFGSHIFTGTLLGGGSFLFVKTLKERLPVGGVLTPVNKVAVLLPYLALVGLILVVTIASRRQKRTQNH